MMCLTSAPGNLLLLSVTGAGTVQTQVALPPIEGMLPGDNMEKALRCLETGQLGR